MSTGINGEFGVNVSFQDRAGSRIKVIQLSDHMRYTAGKVAIVTGTVSSEGSIPIQPANYKNAAGQPATLAVRRAAFSCDRDAFFNDGTGYGNLRSSNGRVSVGDVENAGEVIPLFTSGTASWTVVLWGE